MKLRHPNRAALGVSSLILLIATPSPAHASLLHGETLDTAANILAWVVLIVAPAVALTIFWMLHILPEKIAERRHHPQAKAIQCLCLLSLFFGGLLWPLAWLWAYSKPVLHKLAYGTDVHDPSEHSSPVVQPIDEVQALRQRVAELEAKLKEPGARA